ncbi:MAG: methylenetetrahydromethanopterin dehydrogenase [Gammaproteobacteria bacterium]|nr:methylenetetrahydromethanopterin dehydrogenase [Gammaproteobacteria bacterium]
MKDPYLLPVFSPTKYVSPFDINMAYEAHYDAVIPYCNVTLDEIHALTQDTIFSRGPVGVKRTGIFIGGRDLHRAREMRDAARAAMVPPVEVSVLADPSGAITTAAAMVAMVAMVAYWLRPQDGSDRRGQRVLVLGGTGPVGNCVGLLAARSGAVVCLASKRGAAAAQASAALCNGRYGLTLRGVDRGQPGALAEILDDTQSIFNAAKAGVCVVTAAALAQTRCLRVAVDANGVPPSGMAGVGGRDNGVALVTAGGPARGVGARAVGAVNYRVHTGLLGPMYAAAQPVYLGHEEAFALACALVG